MTLARLLLELKLRETLDSAEDELAQLIWGGEGDGEGGDDGRAGEWGEKPKQRKQPTPAAALAPPLQWHCFLCCHPEQGREQSEDILGMLTRFMPGARVWGASKAGTPAALQALQAAAVVVVFMTKDIFCEGVLVRLGPRHWRVR